MRRAGIARPRQLSKRWQCSLPLTLNSCHGRLLSASQTNGCGRAPPNFAPDWAAIQGARWKLRERIDGLRPLQPPGPRLVAPIPHRLSIIRRARFRRSFDEMPSGGSPCRPPGMSPCPASISIASAKRRTRFAGFRLICHPLRRDLADAQRRLHFARPYLRL
jgi:hypothetical protein